MQRFRRAPRKLPRRCAKRVSTILPGRVLVARRGRFHVAAIVWRGLSVVRRLLPRYPRSRFADDHVAHWGRDLVALRPRARRLRCKTLAMRSNPRNNPPGSPLKLPPLRQNLRGFRSRAGDPGTPHFGPEIPPEVATEWQRLCDRARPGTGRSMSKRLEDSEP
jgi:hypothetical protein